MPLTRKIEAINERPISAVVGRLVSLISSSSWMSWMSWPVSVSGRPNVGRSAILGFIGMEDLRRENRQDPHQHDFNAFAPVAGAHHGRRARYAIGARSVRGRARASDRARRQHALQGAIGAGAEGGS